MLNTDINARVHIHPKALNGMIEVESEGVRYTEPCDDMFGLQIEPDYKAKYTQIYKACEWISSCLRAIQKLLQNKTNNQPQHLMVSVIEGEYTIIFGDTNGCDEYELDKQKSYLKRAVHKLKTVLDE